MRPQFLAAGPWLPDIAPIALARQGLRVARNCVPVAAGYGPQPGLAPVSGYSPLAERPRGSITVRDPGGNVATYVGTETKLYRLGHNGTEDVSRVGAPYACGDRFRWEFALSGRYLIALCPTDDPQYIDIDTGLRFRRLDASAPDAPEGSVGVAPRAHHIGQVGDHVVLGNVNDHTLGPVPASIWWPQIRNPFHWPEPGTDDAVAAQSDRQPLEDDGGRVQRIIGGAEVGLVFQEKSISRLDYRGGDAIFQRTRVEPQRGLLAPALAVAVGRLCFYYAEDGWQAFDYTTSSPIGKERVDRHFKADADFSLLDRASMHADPDTTRFYVLYCARGSATPNRYLCYDWTLRRWSDGEAPAELLVASVYPAGLSLDAPDTPADPDLLEPGLPSFDEDPQIPGAGFFGAFDSSFRLCQWSGAALEARFETGHVQLIPGATTLLTGLRPIVEGGLPFVSVASMDRSTPESDLAWGVEELMDADGSVSPRENGRYHRIRVRIPGGFTSFSGVEVDEYAMSGTR